MLERGYRCLEHTRDTVKTRYITPPAPLPKHTSRELHERTDENYENSEYLRAKNRGKLGNQDSTQLLERTQLTCTDVIVESHWRDFEKRDATPRTHYIEITRSLEETEEAGR